MKQNGVLDDKVSLAHALVNKLGGTESVELDWSIGAVKVTGDIGAQELFEAIACKRVTNSALPSYSITLEKLAVTPLFLRTWGQWEYDTLKLNLSNVNLGAIPANFESLLDLMGPQLLELDVSHNKLTASQVQSLLPGLKQCTQLVVFDITDAEIYIRVLD